MDETIRLGLIGLISEALRLLKNVNTVIEEKMKEENIQPRK